MKAIKKIAVAIDFSANARAAYKYAQVLADMIKAELILIHIHSKNEAQKEVLTRLRRFANNKFIQCEVYAGSPPEKLLALSKEGLFDWLVLGIKEEQGLFDKILKSVHSTLVKKATCPILFIPKKAKIPQKISNIAYAVSALSGEEEGIETITQIAQLFDAKIHFIHVNRPGYRDKQIDIEHLMKDKKEVEYSAKELDYVTIRGAIESYCEAHAVDMVVSMTKRYSFFARIFHNSVTESLMWNTNYPLMVLHKKGK